MYCLRDTILKHVRLRAYVGNFVLAQKENLLKRSCWRMCTSTAHSPDQMIDRVVGLVKKFDRIDSSKVTEAADFQKDLSLDSLDKVELVMAFEQEFSIEIPEEAADKLTCCADVAKYIASMTEGKAAESS